MFRSPWPVAAASNAAEPAYRDTKQPNGALTGRAGLTYRAVTFGTLPKSFRPAGSALPLRTEAAR
jgi:hypothetical protein